MLLLLLFLSSFTSCIIGYIFITFVLESFDSNVYKNWIFKKRSAGGFGLIFSLAVGLFIGPPLWAYEFYEYFEYMEYRNKNMPFIIFIFIITAGSLAGLIYHPIEIYKSKFVNE